MSSETAALKITAEQLDEFVTVEKERKELESKARTLGRRSDALREHFKTFLEQLGKEHCVRHGFRLALIDGRPSVSWKDEFIRLAGPLAADDVLAKAERPKRLEVTPPS